ncbi:hypothetical protein [Mycolicibacterium sp. HK-90]|uniref:hypothetical protein n=1 Tax=Mycolicibacterium sp. HK-90 TaxID=3056937 RepID=UPI00265A0B5B|nr:hypothetical protein [Mycolicibacterium sp. HK-90]WKG06179.1 hypothetical protein QU592_14350 [Mycolicibacterium sp. HK-90]
MTVQPAPGDTPGDDRLATDTGTVLMLSNMHTRCDGVPVDELPDAVRFELDQMLASQDAPPMSELSDAEFLAQMRTRLITPDTSGELSMDYARPAFDGLVAELRRDLPTTVQTVSDSDIEGRDVDLLFDVGQRNTDAEPAEVDSLDHEVFALSGDSLFIASKALNIPRLIETVLDGVAPLGVLFSVPHRGLLFLHRVGASTVEAASWIASATVNATDNPLGGVVSYDTYYWYGGTTQPITRVDVDAHSIAILVGGAFEDALNQVAELHAGN